MKTILLAAGLSTRMGVQKLLLPYGESTIIETVLENLYLSGLTPVYAVFSAEVAKKISEPANWLKIGVNQAPQLGQSSSLAIGLEMLPAGENFCIMLGDLPRAKPGDISGLNEQFNRLPAGYTVLAPFRDGAFGHPMFYSSVWRERFASAAGDAGGKEILKRHWREIMTVDAEDGHFKDIDTPADYELSRGELGRS